MFIRNRCRPLSALVCIGLSLLQALIPCIATAQVSRAASPAPIAGYVNSLTGTVYIRARSVPESPAMPGDLAGSGSILRTGTDGEVILLFSDGLHVTLSADSAVLVEEYRYEPGNPKASRAFFRLMAGTMRVVTGAMHTQNRDALMISGGTAQIGVVTAEVTSFVVDGGAQAEDGGLVAVITGEVWIRTPLGPRTRVEKDQFARWQSGGAAAPQPLAAAPAAIQAAAASGLAIQEGEPLDIKAAAELAMLLATLPAPAAGSPQTPAFATFATAEAVLPGVTPGGGGGCIGSPC